MNSTFKTSLLAAVFSFGVTGSAMAVTHHTHHTGKAHHCKMQNCRDHHRHGGNQSISHQDQATQDLNERSLQTVQSVNRDPNTGVLSPNRQAVVPPAANTVGSPMTGNPVNATAPGTVNPNNMPPAN